MTPRAAEAGAAYARLADGYARRGDHALAEQYFRRALHEGFVLVEVHVGLARTLAALNRLDEAEDHLRRALAIDPASDDALDELAGLYLQGGRVGQALQTMRRRLDAGPTRRLPGVRRAGRASRPAVPTPSSTTAPRSPSRPRRSRPPPASASCWPGEAVSTRPSRCCAPRPTVSSAPRASRTTPTRWPSWAAWTRPTAATARRSLPTRTAARPSSASASCTPAAGSSAGPTSRAAARSGWRRICASPAARPVTSTPCATVRRSAPRSCASSWPSAASSPAYEHCRTRPTPSTTW